MKSTIVLFIFAFIAMSQSAMSKESKPCELLVGTWEGEHDVEASAIHTKHRATLKRDGGFSASIEIIEPEKPKRVETQRSKWVCQGEVFATSTINNNGEESVYRYRILEMNPGYMKYQNFFQEQLGPVFEAQKVDE